MIRVSGEQTIELLRLLTKEPDFHPKPNYTYLRELFDSRGRLLDKGMLVYFKGPKSFNGEGSRVLH